MLAVASAAHSLCPVSAPVLVETFAAAVALVDDLDELCAELDAFARLDVRCFRFTVASPALLWLKDIEADPASVAAGSLNITATERPKIGKKVAASAFRGCKATVSLHFRMGGSRERTSPLCHFN